MQCYYLTSSTATRERLVDTLLAELEPNPPAWPGVTPLENLRGVLQARRSQGLLTALAIDEADRLNEERLAELCELLALRADDAQLLPLVLAGQPGAGCPARSVRPGAARGARGRRCELAPLDLAQSASYILWRARAAGAPGSTLFTREAVTLIHEYADGVPRTINVICDNALLAGFLRRQKPVTRDTVSEVCSQLDLTDTGVANCCRGRPAGRLVRCPPSGGPVTVRPEAGHDLQRQTGSRAGRRSAR